MSDRPIRSFAKAVSWRITASIATFLISLFISDNIAIATTIASIQLVVNFLLYFVHERIWNKITWGHDASS